MAFICKEYVYKNTSTRIHVQESRVRLKQPSPHSIESDPYYCNKAIVAPPPPPALTTNELKWGFDIEKYKLLFASAWAVYFYKGKIQVPSIPERRGVAWRPPHTRLSDSLEEKLKVVGWKGMFMSAKWKKNLSFKNHKQLLFLGLNISYPVSHLL